MHSADMEEATLGKPGSVALGKPGSVAALPQATAMKAMPMRTGAMSLHMPGQAGRRPVQVHAASLQFIKGQDE